MRLDESCFHKKFSAKHWIFGQYFIPKFFDNFKTLWGLNETGRGCPITTFDIDWWFPYEEPPKRVEWGFAVFDDDGICLSDVPVMKKEAQYEWKEKFLGFASFDPVKGVFYWEGE